MKRLKPQAVIFDLGSTLIEYEAVPWDELNIECAAAACKMLRKRKLGIPDDDLFLAAFENVKNEFRKVAKDSFVEWDIVKAARRLLDRLNVPFDEKLLDDFFDAYYEPVRKRLYIYDDTLETLAQLRKTYSTLGLISNTIFPERSHQEELKRFGIAPYLDFTLFSSSFGIRKPHSDIFNHAARLANAEPSDCVYVGDRYLEDVEGPAGVGMTPILKIVPRRVYPDVFPEDLRRIERLSQLLDHLHH